MRASGKSKSERVESARCKSLVTYREGREASFTPNQRQRRGTLLAQRASAG